MSKVKLPKGYEIRHRNAIRDGDNSVPKWASDAYDVLDGRTDHVASGRTPGAAKRNAMASGRTNEPFDTPTKVDTGSYYARQFDDRGKPRRSDDYARRERNASGLQDKDEGGDYARRKRNASGYQDENRGGRLKRGGRA